MTLCDPEFVQNLPRVNVRNQNFPVFMIGIYVKSFIKAFRFQTEIFGFYTELNLPVTITCLTCCKIKISSRLSAVFGLGDYLETGII